MKKQFVTYPIALALKELEFDEECCALYRKDRLFTVIGFEKINSVKQSVIAAPLWQQTIDWFDKKGIIIEIVKDPALRNIGNHSFTFCVYQKTKESFFNPMYVTRYEAREKAVLKAIELCKNTK